MIEKYYQVKCDNCGEVLLDEIKVNNVYEALESAKQNTEYFITKGNKSFCNAECFTNYYKEK